MTGEIIESNGDKRTPTFIKSLGCIAPVFSTIAGTTTLIVGALKNSNPENAAVYCATGLGMIFFGLLMPAISKIFKK